MAYDVEIMSCTGREQSKGSSTMCLDFMIKSETDCGLYSHEFKNKGNVVKWFWIAIMSFNHRVLCGVKLRVQIPRYNKIKNSYI